MDGDGWMDGWVDRWMEGPVQDPLGLGGVVMHGREDLLPGGTVCESANGARARAQERDGHTV